MQGSMPERWHPQMARGDPRARITPRMWRKSSQWVALARPLARLVAEDAALAAVFRATCWERDDEELQECALFTFVFCSCFCATTHPPGCAMMPTECARVCWALCTAMRS